MLSLLALLNTSFWNCFCCFRCFRFLQALWTLFVKISPAAPQAIMPTIASGPNGSKIMHLTTALVVVPIAVLPPPV